MKAFPLEAKRRDIVGRKVKTLRKNGFIPGTIYGKTMESLSIQIEGDQFSKAFHQTGETGLINLTIDKKVFPVLIKQVQRDPVSGRPIHTELYCVNLKEKIRAHVPIVIRGESQAIKEKTGMLLQLLNEIEVEAFPADLPEHVEADISSLVAVDDHITAKSLSLPKDVALITDPEIMVVKIGELLAPEPEPTPTPAEGEALQEEGDGEKKDEGEEKENPNRVPEEEKKSEEKPKEHAKD